MKYFIYFLSFIYIWDSEKFAHAEIKQSTNNPDWDELFMCDYTRIDSQLEMLKTGNDFLKLHIELMQIQMDKQKVLFDNLEKKVNNIPRQMQIIENKLLQNNNNHFGELKDLLNGQNHLNQNQVQVPPPTDDKHFIMADIKEILKNHDHLLDNIANAQNINTFLLKEANWENHVQTLKDNISNKLTILDKMDKKLTDIGNKIMTKAEQMIFYRDVQKKCTIQAYPTNCADFDRTNCADNQCRIHNHYYGPEPFLVACNDQVEGGGWTVIQRRINGSVDFYRNWSEYKNGFGHIDGEFFIGLDKLYALTNTLKPVELLIQLQDFNDTMKYAKYDAFEVGNETDQYKLIKVGSYTGDAGDAFSFHEGQNFSTKDQDNDSDPTSNCAEDKTGAWWYKSCMWSNLNGKYYDDPEVPKSKRGICWSEFHGYNYSLKFVQMMIRPRRL